MKAFFASILMLLAATAHVDAHASMQPPVAIPNKSTAAAIRIPHGCNKTATTRVTVKIPDGVTGVKPQLISPWQIEIKTRPLVPPTSETNTTADEISWFGGFLPEEYYMDFGMTMKLPDGPDGKTVAFDVIQECVTGKNEWVGQIAPKITLMKNGTLVKAEDFGFNASNAQLGPATNSQQTNSAGRVGLSIAGVVGVVGSLVALL